MYRPAASRALPLVLGKDPVNMPDPYAWLDKHIAEQKNSLGQLWRDLGSPEITEAEEPPPSA